MAALQTLRNPQPADNIALITNTLHLAKHFRTLDITITLCWLPWHANIRGDELADQAARAASFCPHMDVHVPPSLVQVKSRIQRNMGEYSSREHAAEVENGSPLATWYAEATQLRPLVILSNFHPRIRADIHRLRLGYHSSPEIFGTQAFCEHFEAPTAVPLLHYILQCAATTEIRKKSYIS